MKTREAILAKVDKNWDTFQKLYFIQSVISERTKYYLNDDDLRTFNIVGCFVTGKCVCAGMAAGFKWLSDSLNL